MNDALPTLETDTPGLLNKGLLSDYQLTPTLRKADEWNEDWNKAEQWIASRNLSQGGRGQTGAELLQSLGFVVEPHKSSTHILRKANTSQKVAVRVLLKPEESPEQPADQLSISPFGRGLTVADQEKVSYVLIQQGSKQGTTLRLYHLGSDRAGQRHPDAHIQIFTGLLHHAAATAPYLWLIFSAEALVPGGTLARLLDDSPSWTEDKKRWLDLGMRLLQSNGRVYRLQCKCCGWTHEFTAPLERGGGHRVRFAKRDCAQVSWTWRVATA